MSALMLDIVHEARSRPRLTARRVRGLVAATEHVVRVRLSGSIACTCVTDRAMQTLNRRYRRKNKTTDVLSFLYSDAKRGRVRTIVGDIILSPAEAARQAKERRMSISAVMDELVVHALLHLLGYDHERSKKDARLMLGLQERILEI